MRDFKNYLFDLDGTLIDSQPLHERAFRGALTEDYPNALPYFHYEAFAGYTTREVFTKLGVTDDQKRERLIQKKQAAYRQMVADGKLQLLAGAIDLLSFLKERKKRLFLVTGGSRASVEKAIDSTGIASVFQNIITANDVTNGKPDPECYALCLKRYTLINADSIVVEDAPSGVSAARAAGITTLGVHNPALKDQADFWFPTLLDILNIIKQTCLNGVHS